MDTPEQIMWKLMKRVHKEECIWKPALVCPECRGIPLQPVTGICGHTWCKDCVQDGCVFGYRCVCGAPSPTEGAVDVLVRDLIETMFPYQREAAVENRRAGMLLNFHDPKVALRLTDQAIKHDPRNVQLRLTRAKIFWKAKDNASARSELECIMKVDPRLFEAHYIMAHILKDQKNYHTALKYFYVSWLLGKPLGVVRDKMVEIIKKLIKKEQNRPRLMAKISRNVKAMMRKCTQFKAESVEVPPVVQASDLLCVVCSQCYVRPVATPCGHTFCRLCIERCLDHNLGCPLCNASIEDMRRSKDVNESAFVKVLVSRLPKELRCRQVEKPDMLPVLVCTSGFPSVPCPMMIKDGCYKLLIRRALESGSRKFGMLSCKPCPRGPTQTYRFSEYGTMLEIRNCITGENGRLIITTVGLKRFRVLASEEIDGYDVVRFETIRDKPVVSNAEVERLKSTARSKAQNWVRHLPSEVRESVEYSYGPMPSKEIEWEDDGPAWMWWLLAALPLTIQLKRMLLGTTELVLRLRAIDKSLDLRKWSLRQQQRRNRFCQHVETEQPDPETPLTPAVERWLFSPRSLDGRTASEAI